LFSTTTPSRYRPTGCVTRWPSGWNVDRQNSHYQVSLSAAATADWFGHTTSSPVD
jgi:hypothetical protein